MSEIIRTADPVSPEIVELARRVAWAGHKFDVDGNWHKRRTGLVAQVKRLGAGHFSRVYSLPGHDDLVVKVGGRAAYGDGYSRPDHDVGMKDAAGLPAWDQWPAYIEVAAKDFAGEPWVPSVHHFEKLRSGSGSLYFAVMERLSPADERPCPRELHSLLQYKANALGVRLDLHDDNYMRRPGTEQIVITDPWSRRVLTKEI